MIKLHRRNAKQGSHGDVGSPPVPLTWENVLGVCFMSAFSSGPLCSEERSRSVATQPNGSNWSPPFPLSCSARPLLPLALPFCHCVRPCCSASKALDSCWAFVHPVTLGGKTTRAHPWCPSWPAGQSREEQATRHCTVQSALTTDFLKYMNEYHRRCTKFTDDKTVQSQSEQAESRQVGHPSVELNQGSAEFHFLGRCIACYSIPHRIWDLPCAVGSP